MAATITQAKAKAKQQIKFRKQKQQHMDMCVHAPLTEYYKAISRLQAEINIQAQSASDVCQARAAVQTAGH